MDDHAQQVLEYREILALLREAATTELGAALAEKLRPSSDPARLRESLAQVDEARFLLDEGNELRTLGLSDVSGVIAHAREQNRPLEPTELLDLRRMLGTCVDLRQQVERHKEKVPRLEALTDRLQDHTSLVRRIDGVVVPPGEIRDDASPKLLRLRQQQRAIEERVRAVMARLCEAPEIRPHLRERSFSIRNGRWVLAVKLDKKGYVPGILHDKSASGGTAFVEPREVLVLANELEEARLDGAREEARVLREVAQEVFAEAERLAYTQQVAAWLDFTAARARLGARYGWRAATLVDDPVVKLRGARHPLLDVAAQQDGGREVVPLDLEIGRSFRTLVVTGPNTGGKTVVLKTLGLLQLMFQSGLHLPVASGCELPCLQDVLADIGDEQSLSQNLSTFSGHVRNIASILGAARERSLVLLDELGAGTDPAEGAALGQALLKRLGETGALVIVTTHLGVLKTYGFRNPDVENGCVTFDPKTFEPTYRLLVGQPGRSNALIIAERYGVPAEIVAAARGQLERSHEGTQELIDDLMSSRLAAERSRKRSEDLKEESERRLQDAQRALDDAEQERRKVEVEAEAEVARILDLFAQEARKHLNALKNVPKGLVGDVGKLEELVRTRAKVTPFAERRRDFVRGLKKHDKVWVPRFEQVCRIEKLNRGEERITVRVGGMSVQIGFDDVSWVTPPQAPGAE